MGIANPFYTHTLPFVHVIDWENFKLEDAIILAVLHLLWLQ